MENIDELLKDITTEQLQAWLEYWQQQLNAHYPQKIRNRVA